MVVAPAPLAPLPRAVIPVHVTYVLRTLRPSLDALFPAQDSLTAAACKALGGFVCHQYVYRRDSLQLRSAGDHFTLDTQLAYRAQVGALGSASLAGCGFPPDTPRRADLSLTTTLYWRRDWRIGVKESRLAAMLRDPCRVTALGVDATKTLQGLIDKQLARFSAQADSIIPTVANFGPLADTLWQGFQQPQALDSAGTLWMLLDPEEVRVTPFVGNGPAITTDLVLFARPRIVTGARPTVRPRPLPPLTLGEAPATFTVPVRVDVTFADIARRAAALLADETRDGAVRVDGVNVVGRGDTVRVQLAVSGAIRGQLELAARLQWDASAQRVTLDDLDWTVSSRGALSKVTATLAAPLIARAVNKATMGGRVPLDAQLAAVRTELLRTLNGAVGPGILLGSSVTGVRITNLTTTAHAVVVSALLEGTAGVWLQPPSTKP